MSKKHKIIHLHVYRGKQGAQGIVKDEKGKVLNINNLVKLTHNTKEWDDYLKMLRINGFVKVEVKGFLAGLKSNGDLELNNDGSFKYNEVPESVLKEVKEALKGSDEVKLTPEQKEIAELKTQMAELISGNKEKVPSKVDPELDKAREDYEKVYSEKGHHLWSLSTILEKIKEKSNQKS